MKMKIGVMYRCGVQTLLFILMGILEGSGALNVMSKNKS